MLLSSPAFPEGADPATAAAWRGFLAAAFGAGATIDAATLARVDRPPPASPSVPARIAALFTLGVAGVLILVTIALVLRSLV